MYNIDLPPLSIVVYSYTYLVEDGFTGNSYQLQPKVLLVGDDFPSTGSVGLDPRRVGGNPIVGRKFHLFHAEK
jgi:hypothetical protein